MWRTWLLQAGRGFGKTRTGAEWVRSQVGDHHRTRVALVAPTAADARDVMVEGESGILAISPEWDRPHYEPSKRRLTWPNGAIATTYSADEPERLRGPQHDAAWCDEVASWRYPEAWDMLMFGLRLGDDPRVVVTTTPNRRQRRHRRVRLGREARPCVAEDRQRSGGFHYLTPRRMQSALFASVHLVLARVDDPSVVRRICPLTPEDRVWFFKLGERL